MGRKKQGNVVCKYPGCNYEIYWACKMKRHVKSVHQKQNDFLCELCQKSFRCNFSLNRHKRLKHKPVVIHFMRKEAIATVTSDESFVADHENTPIQTNFEVQNSVENCVTEKQDKHFQPVVQPEKLKKVDIAMYTQKHTLQPKNSLTKFNNKSGQKNLLMRNDMSSRTEKKNTKAEETFVSQYNFHNDYWPRQKALETKKKTSTVKNDFAEEGVSEKRSSYKIPKYRECNIFESLDLFYWPSRFAE